MEENELLQNSVDVESTEVPDGERIDEEKYSLLKYTFNQIEKIRKEFADYTDQAQAAFNVYSLALDVLKEQIKEEYRITDEDSLDLNTGTIIRAAQSVK